MCYNIGMAAGRNIRNITAAGGTDMLKDLKMIAAATLLALAVSAALQAVQLLPAATTTEQTVGIIPGYSWHGNAGPAALH